MAKDTKIIVVNSFLSLLKENDKGRITESELSRHSGIMRSTLRHNFGNDVVSGILDYIYSQIAEEIYGAFSPMQPWNVTLNIFSDLFLPIAWAHRNELQIIFQSHSINVNVEEIFKAFWSWSQPVFEAYLAENKKVFAPLHATDLFAYFTHHVVGIIFLWMTEPYPERPESFQTKFIYLLNLSTGSLFVTGQNFYKKSDFR